MSWFNLKTKLTGRSSKKPVNSLKLESPTQRLGAFYEKEALRFLQDQGLSLIAENYRCNLGEIDLIMKDNNDVVFIEVKYRKADAFGGGAASVTLNKQQKVIKAAQHFLLQNNLSNKVPCRFDVIVFDQNNINWLKSAFH